MGLRGLRQAAFGVGPPRTQEIGLQGVPEQALPEVRRRGSPGAEPGADAARATSEPTRYESRVGLGTQDSGEGPCLNPRGRRDPIPPLGQPPGA